MERREEHEDGSGSGTREGDEVRKARREKVVVAMAFFGILVVLALLLWPTVLQGVGICLQADSALL